MSRALLALLGVLALAATARATCDNCLEFYAGGGRGDYEPFAGSACDVKGKILLAEFAPFADWIKTGFDTYSCEDGNTLITCGNWKKPEYGIKFAQAMEKTYGDNLDGLLTKIFGGCTAATADVTFSVMTVKPKNPVHPEACGVLEGERTCPPPLVSPPSPTPRTPFPFCECNKKVSATPFAVDGTSWYHFDGMDCIDLMTQDASGTGRCPDATTLYKVEFWLNYEDRFKIEETKVYSSEGDEVDHKRAWGKPSENTFKITDLGLTGGLDIWAVDGLTVCIRLADDLDITDISASDSGVWVSLFDDSYKCCPTTLVE